MSGIITINRGAPSPPPEAAAVGYTKLLFFDDFNSISTIDVNDTRAPGFNWYVHSFLVDSSLAQPADIVVANSLLTLTGHSSTVRCQMFSIYPSGLHTYGGNNFPGSTGFYMEARLAFDPTLSPGSSPSLPVGWPTIWTTSDDLHAAEMPPAIAGVNAVEVDIIEPLPDTVGTVKSQMFDFYLSTITTSPFYQILAENQNDIPAARIPTYTNLNQFGALFVPMARNGGTGYVKRFINGVYLPLNSVGGSMDITWTPGSPYSHVESDSFCLLMLAGNNWPLILDYVAVWGPP